MDRLGDDPVFLEPPQPVRQNIGSDFLLGGEIVLEFVPLLEEQIADDEQRPSVSENLETDIQRAVRASRRRGVSGHPPSFMKFACNVQANLQSLVNRK